MPNIITFFLLFFFFFCSHKPSAQTFVPVGDLSMSDQGVLPKLISNITSDLSRARDLPGPLSDVALHEARFTESKTMVALDLYSSLGRHVSPSLFTRSSSTAHHPALPVSTTGISAQQVPVAVSLGIAAAAENATCRSRVVYYHCA